MARPTVRWEQHHDLVDRKKIAGKRVLSRLERLFDEGYIDLLAFEAGERLRKWHAVGIVGIRDRDMSGIPSGFGAATISETRVNAVTAYERAMAMLREEGGPRVCYAVERSICWDEAWAEIARRLGTMERIDGKSTPTPDFRTVRNAVAEALRVLAGQRKRAA